MEAGDPPDSLAPFVSEDSAGVRIVENHAPAWEGEERWRIDPEPELSIGMADGPEDYVLPNVFGASAPSDGTIVIGLFVSRSLFELRYYGPDGTHLATSGGYGSGPGELNTVNGLARLPGDFVLVVGDRGSRFAVFGPRGLLERTGRVLVLHSGELGVRRVRKHRLIRPAPAP